MAKQADDKTAAADRRVVVYLDDDLRRRARIAAAHADSNLSEWVRALIDVAVQIDERKRS